MEIPPRPQPLRRALVLEDPLKGLKDKSAIDREAILFLDLAQRYMRAIRYRNLSPLPLQLLATGLKQNISTEVKRIKARQASIEYGNTSPDEVKVDPLGLMSLDLPEFCGVGIVQVSFKGEKRKKWVFSREILQKHFGGVDPYSLAGAMDDMNIDDDEDSVRSEDIITRICQCTELAIEVGKYLEPEDILNLYSTSRAFHFTLKAHMKSSIKTWINFRAPEAGRVFPYNFYHKHLISDPVGRTWKELQVRPTSAGEIAKEKARKVPSIKYLQLVLGRDRCCREIIAIMARNGHRMPESMHNTLLKLWLIMELPVNKYRQAFLMDKEIWAEKDLYNAQLFIVKLVMHFNDPVYGPNTPELMHLFMGQKGLYPLWQLLLRRKFTSLREIVQLKVQYDFEVPSDKFRGLTVYGVPFNEVGIGHRENWGKGGKIHLMRPDELITFEATRRRLSLEDHLMHMVLWGYFDWNTGENLVPTNEEMHISNEEELLRNVDRTHHWQPKHNLKKRFAELEPEQQQEIIDEDEDDRLRAMAWCDDIEDYESLQDSDEDEGIDIDENPGDNGTSQDVYGKSDDEMLDVEDEREPPDLDEEINRGYILRPLPKNDKPQVPNVSDHKGWNDFVNELFMDIPPQMEEDELERAEAWYPDNETDPGAWDWVDWMNEDADLEEEDTHTTSTVPDIDLTMEWSLRA